MSPRECGELVASSWAPLSDGQVEEIAKVLVTVEIEQAAA